MLRLYYLTVICTFFCLYLGTILINRNELMSDIAKELQTQITHNVQFSYTKNQSILRGKEIKINNILIRQILTHGA